MKKTIILIIGVVIIIGGIMLYKKHQQDQELAASLSEVTQYRQDNINQETQDITSYAEKASPFPVTSADKKEIQKAVIEVDAIGADAGIKSAISQVPASAEIYMSFTNGNYGTSPTKNFCRGDENNVEYILNIIKKYSKTPAACTVSSSFPAKSFTVTASSVTQSGFYCTDQSGFQGLISLTNNQFKAGIQCK